MSEIDDRMEKILPILEDRVTIQMKKFEETLNVDSFVKPMIKGVKKRKEKIEARKELTEAYKMMMPVAFKPVIEMTELQEMTKKGVANILQAMGYKTKVDETLKGFSGNTYYVSVLAPAQHRTLIVDQTMLSSQLMGNWLNVQFPKTFDSSKVTIADFFKYLDISLALKETPTIYWLHDYKVSSELADKVGFSWKRLTTEMVYAIGRKKGMSDEEIDSASLTDDEFKELANKMDEFLSGIMKSFAKPMMNLTNKNQPLPFDVRKTAKRFYIPYISTSLSDILYASTLNPLSTTDRRYLKGTSLDLGLLDFLNPPWPDYILEIASRGKSTFEEASHILTVAECTGHPSRAVKELAITPKKVIADPADGIEVLEQHGLVIEKQKETYKITPDGREYVKEIHKRPKTNALKKAVELLKNHFSIGLPFGQFNFKGKE